MGIDPAMISELTRSISRGDYGRQKSLLILRHGQLIHEQYFNGYLANENMPVYSVTKSWASMLMGMAMRNGEMPGLETPLADIFTQYAPVFAQSPAKRDITMDHMLSMRTGQAWDEWSTFFTDPVNPVNQMLAQPDWWQFVLERSLVSTPGTRYAYSTGNSNLMGGLIYSETGMSALQYAQQHLFPVLDINSYHVEVALSDRPQGTGITQFQQGLTPTGHGLWLRPQDMAKIGQTYLDRGVWQNQRLIDQSWVELSWGRYSDQSTDPDVFGTGLSYGYQWWNMHIDEINGEGPEVNFAWGYAEQFIFVVPELDLVVVSTADNGAWEGPSMITAVREVIVPGVAAAFDPASDGGLTGTWFAPELNGQGFMLEVVPSTGQIVIYWMTFEPGTGEQMWLIAVGQLNGRRAVLEFLQPQGGSFGAVNAVTFENWGELELVFSSCLAATVTFASEVAGVSGSIDLTRVTPNETCIENADQQ